MLLQLNNKYSKLNKYYGYAFILLLTLIRVLSTTPRPCPEFFDCNSYIQMVDSIAYDPVIAPHHAMRILPPLMIKGLHAIGFNIETAFRVLSDCTYVLFGLLCFGVLRQYVKPIVALSFTLLCLAPHSAMRISLQNVYQSCDMLVYPISLLIIYFSLNRKLNWVFCLSILGIFVRQNLFVLGFTSLCYLLLLQRDKKIFFYLFALLLSYFGLQTYYHANSSIANMALIPAGFFEIDHLFWVFKDSKIYEIMLPMLPLILIFYRSLIPFMMKQWHITLYMAVVVGQPFVAYHLTGNNFARLALQGLWLIYFLIPIANNKKQPKELYYLLLAYAFGIYITWNVFTRSILMLLFVIGYFMILSMYRANRKQATDISAAC